MLDRMPLHSAATSISMLGRKSTNPSRATGIPNAMNSASVARVEPYCRVYVTALSTFGGRGTRRSQNNKGKMHFLKMCTP